MSRMIEITLPPLTGEQERRLWEVWAGLWFRQDEDPWIRQDGWWFLVRGEQEHHGEIYLDMVARKLLQAVFCVDCSLGFQARLLVTPADTRAQPVTITYRDLARWHERCEGCDDPLCQVPDHVPLTAELVRRFLVHTRDRASKPLSQLAENLLQRADGLGSMRSMVPEVIELLGDKARQALLTMPGTAQRIELEDEARLLRRWLTLTRRVAVPLPLAGASSVETGVGLLKMLTAETWDALQSYRLPCWHAQPHEVWTCEACEAIRALKQGIAAQLRLARPLAWECLRQWTLASLPYYSDQCTAALDLMAWADVQTVSWVMPALEWIPQEEAALAQWAVQEVTRLWESTWNEYGLPAPEASLPANKMKRLGERYAKTFRHALAELEKLAPVETLHCTSPTSEPLGSLPTCTPAHEDQ